MSRQDADQIIRFDAFELDLRAGELRRGGIRLPVQGRPIQALAVLLRNPGQLVTREQLREELWPADTFVDFEHGLHNAVARIRSILGDTAETPRFIETLPRRGYRFIAPLEPVPALTPEPEPAVATSGAEGERATGGANWALGKAGLAALVVVIVAALILLRAPSVGSRTGAERIDSLAVLPLQNFSGDPEQEYFADGMTEELITELTHIKALRVVSRTSVARYKGTRKTAPEIAGELHVQAILEGSVARAGERIRISARLIRAANDQPVWSQSYDSDVRDVLRLQADVARSIAREIQIELTPDERARLTAARQVDPDAFRLYLKGRYFWEKRSRDSIHKAIEYFNQAIEKDPSYAAAYSGLADCYSSLGFSFDVGEMAPQQVQPRAMAAAARAIALDPSLSEAHTSLAFIKLTYDWDWANAEAEFQRGIALNPRAANGHHWYAHYLMAAGRTREAEKESRRALELDPISLIMNVHLGWHFIYAHQYDEALDQLRKAVEADPNYGLAHWYSGLAYEQKGMYADALREMKRAKELLPENAIIDSDIGHLYAVAGRRREATAILTQLQDKSARSYVSSFELALIHAGLGEKEKSLSEMEQAYRERSDMLVYLGVDRRLDALRPDPRFGELLRRIAIPR
jgi:TolB-like protein/DNA-binding winged helix-turn-helix (wHTH) protein/Tfp pilus assembly protein PilF